MKTSSLSCTGLKSASEAPEISRSPTCSVSSGSSTSVSVPTTVTTERSTSHSFGFPRLTRPSTSATTTTTSTIIGGGDVSGVYLRQDTHQQAIVAQHMNNATRNMTAASTRRHSSSKRSSLKKAKSFGTVILKRVSFSGSHSTSGRRVKSPTLGDSDLPKPVLIHAHSPALMPALQPPMRSSATVTGLSSASVRKMTKCDSVPLPVSTTIDDSSATVRRTRKGDSDYCDETQELVIDLSARIVGISSEDFERKKPPVAVDFDTPPSIDSCADPSLSPATVMNDSSIVCSHFDSDLASFTPTPLTSHSSCRRLRSRSADVLASKSASTLWHRPRISKSRLFRRGGRKRRRSRSAMTRKGAIPEEESTGDWKEDSGTAESGHRGKRKRKGVSSMIHGIVSKSRKMSATAAKMSKSVAKRSGKIKLIAMRSAKQKGIVKYPFINEIPYKLAELWLENLDNELNHFCKLACHEKFKTIDPSFHDINWTKRISTDIIRAGKLYVSGDIHEVFEFPNFKTTDEKLALVDATIKYLQCAVSDLMLEQQMHELEDVRAIVDTPTPTGAAESSHRSRGKWPLEAEAKHSPGTDLLSLPCVELAVYSSFEQEPDSGSGKAKTSGVVLDIGKAESGEVGSGKAETSAEIESAEDGSSIKGLKTGFQLGSKKPLSRESIKVLSQKTVRQTLISLCQDFVNDPYFTHLKQVCNEYDLQPVDLGLMANGSDAALLQQLDAGIEATADSVEFRSWQPRLCIEVNGDEIHAMVCRMFRCLWFQDIEAVETPILLGFKRTYCISTLPKPLRILPPVWLVHDSETNFSFELTPDKYDCDDLLQSF